MRTMPAHEKSPGEIRQGLVDKGRAGSGVTDIQSPRLH